MTATSPSETLSWCDVLVTAAPPFAPPLRARWGHEDATHVSNREMRFALALAGVAEGRGDLYLEVRMVLCSARACSPVVTHAKAAVRVGGP